MALTSFPRRSLVFSDGGRVGNLADCAFKCLLLCFVFSRGSQKLPGLLTFSQSSAFARNSKGLWPPDEGTWVEVEVEKCGGIEHNRNFIVNVKGNDKIKRQPEIELGRAYLTDTNNKQ